MCGAFPCPEVAVSEPIDLPAIDEPPKSGVFIEHDDLIPTDDEIDEGNRLGEEIDVDDDEDNGL